MDIFSVLAEPTRRNIVEMLASQGQLSASTISDKFRVSPPAISQHLKVLRDAHVVTVKKHAQQRLYTINPQALEELETWAKKMKRIWNDRYDALDEVLHDEQQKMSKNSVLQSSKLRRKGK